MKNNTTKTLPTTYARTAGLMYLLIAIIGGFSIGYLPTIILVEGDASSTAQNLIENAGLFKLGIGADVFVFIMELVLTVMLYQMLKKVNQTISLIALFSRLAMGIIMGLNLLNYTMPLLLLSGSGYLNTFSLDELQSLSLLFLNIHQYGVYVWGLFFALHLVFLGYLIYKSNYVPKIMGILMMVGSLGYIGESLIELTFSQSEIISKGIIITLIASVLGELSFAIWLLVTGAQSKHDKKNKVELT